MDEHISLQVIDEPLIKDISFETGDETLEDDNSDLQNFLKTWASVDMNPDKLNTEEDNFEAQQHLCYTEARQHVANALEEFRYMSIILENVISGSHLDREYAESQPRELNNPDVPLGSNVIDKQLQLQSSANFLSESLKELKAEVEKFKNYFQKLDELSHRFPIGFFFDYVRLPMRAAVIPPDPLYFDIPWIVLQPDKNGDINWRLSYPMNFYINQKNIFFDSKCPYRRLTSQVLLQYLFQIIRFEMISLNIDYTICNTSTKLLYTAQNTFNFELEASSEKKMKKKSDLCPPYIPALVSQSINVNPQPFKKFKELIDERVLIKNAVNTVLERFIYCDFCEVKHIQRKRVVMIEITPLFGYFPSEIKKDKNSNYNPTDNQNSNQDQNDDDQQNQNEDEEDLYSERIQPYNITCYLAKNHFCATDPQSLYSYVNIDLRSRGANNALNKWCESHYFRMFQLSVAVIASRFGFSTKMNDRQISVKCDNTRKVKFYTTGRGDVDVVVTDDGFKWKRKWSNLDFPIYGTLKKIEYLFFFNFSFK